MSTVIEVKKDGKRWKVMVNWVKRADRSTAEGANAAAKEIKDKEHPDAILRLSAE